MTTHSVTLSYVTEWIGCGKVTFSMRDIRCHRNVYAVIILRESCLSLSIRVLRFVFSHKSRKLDSEHGDCTQHRISAEKQGRQVEFRNFIRHQQKTEKVRNSQK